LLRLLAGDPCGKDFDLFLQQASEDANERFDRLPFAIDHFRKPTSPLSIEIERGVREFGGRGLISGQGIRELVGSGASCQ
jgi:hypothetical protein